MITTPLIEKKEMAFIQGATTLSIMTFNIMAFSIMKLSIMKLSIMTFSITRNKMQHSA
jgi:hypothetical protein